MWGVAKPLGPYGRRGCVAGPLGPVWPQWEQVQFPWPRMGAVGHGRVLGPVLAPWKWGLSPGPCMVTVGAWPCPWAAYGRRGDVAGTLGSVWPPWK